MTAFIFTIDTNLINVRKGMPAMNVLERWHAERKIELVGAHRLKVEAKSHPLQPQANGKAATLKNVSEPYVWGIGSWGESMWGAEDAYPPFSDLAEALFPGRAWQSLSQNQINDVMHLMGHVGGGAYAFLTNNTKDFIDNGRQQSLLERFGIRVMTPDEAVAMLTSSGSDF